MTDLRCGDCLEILKSLPSGSVDCCVTSPPYFALRDYNAEGQIGLEATPAEYVSKLLEVFTEVRRVLKPQGTLWLNLGDSYGSGTRKTWGADKKAPKRPEALGAVRGKNGFSKQLIGIPWRVAFALQEAGWILRSDIIWSKPNAMPESVKDRPTKAHEYVFLLTKQGKYFYDADAVREAHSYKDSRAGGNGTHYSNGVRYHEGVKHLDTNVQRGVWMGQPPNGKNMRSVWTINTQPYPEAHFATFPEELARRCVLAGCPEEGTVLDPFCGSGTVGAVAKRYGRRFIGIDLNPDYLEMARRRIAKACRQLELEVD